MLPEVGILLLLAVSTHVRAQTCEAFGGSPSYCSSLIDYQVYVPAGQTQATLAASIQALTNSYGLIPQPCRHGSVQLACSKTFRSCNDSTPTAVILCPEVCTGYNSDCTEIIKQHLASAENCTASDPSHPGAYLYLQPGDSQACAIANSSSAPPSKLVCVDPFVFNPKKGECTISCPPPGLDDPKWHRRIQLTHLITLIFSLILEFLLLASWAAMYDAKQPLYVAYYVVAITASHCGMFIGKWLPYTEWMCVHPWEIRTQSSSSGAIAALLTYGGTLATAAWVCVVLYHLVNTIWDNKFQLFGPDRLISWISPFWAYQIFAWLLIPVPLTVAMFGGEWAALTSGWIMYPDARPRNGWILNGLVFIPLTIFITVNLALMLVLFYRIFRVAGTLGLRAQARLIGLCAIYQVAIGYGTFYAWWQVSDRDHLTAQITDYVTCKLNTPGLCTRVPWLGGAGGFVASVFITALGIANFFILVDMRFLALWNQWLHIGGFKWNPEWRSISHSQSPQGSTSNSPNASTH